MTAEYEAYLKHRQISPPEEGLDFIAHYGVKGQKWGVRNYQYEGGGYTPAGAERYWGGNGQRRQGYNGGTNGGATYRRQQTARMTGGRSTLQRSTRPTNARYATSSQSNRSQLTPEQRAARRARTRKVIGITAGVAVAAAVGYAAYKGSTNARDQMRADVYKNMDGDFSKVRTLNSKYWNSDDRRKYSELTRQHAEYTANNITRRDAAAAKFAQKTGIQITMPQSRAKVLEQRHEQNTYANWIRGAENRANQNREIHDARQRLKDVQKQYDRNKSTRFSSQDARYGTKLDSMWEEQVQVQKENLNKLLEKRRAAS